MGVCINYKGAQEIKYVKKTLDLAEARARKMAVAGPALGFQVTVRRPDDNTLYVDMDGVETLSFEFRPFPENDGSKWNYKYEVLEDYEHINRSHTGDHYEQWPEQKLLWFSGFTKTQYGVSIIEHKFFADLVREVTGRCVFAMVDDEGDYYHTGRLEDAAEAIGATAQVIAGILGQLKEASFWDDEIIGNATTIKPLRADKK